jgi:hypothetical protein
MKHGAISFSSAVAAVLLTGSISAWANAKPDFDDDATPILRMQPGLLEYVESRFEVKDTGTAKYPGDDDRRPSPPYIFRARPVGSHGPYNLRLLIQPGQPGHILGVVDITKVHLNSPENPAPRPSVATHSSVPSSAPAPQAPVNQPAVSQSPANQPANEAPSASTPAQPNEPTADTPSGPISDSGSPAPSSQPSLTPPPDPAPAAQ